MKRIVARAIMFALFAQSATSLQANNNSTIFDTAFKKQTLFTLFAAALASTVAWNKYKKAEKENSKTAIPKPQSLHNPGSLALGVGYSMLALTGTMFVVLGYLGVTGTLDQIYKTKRF